MKFLRLLLGILTLTAFAAALDVMPARANGTFPPSTPPKKTAPAKKAPAKKSATKSSSSKKKTVKATAKKTSQTAADKLRAEMGWRQGQALVEEGDYRAAISFLNRFLKGYQKSADGWYWLSRAYHEEGDYDRSQWAANIALQIDPYYAALTKTPSGIQPLAPATKESKKYPRPSMSVLPVKPVLPAKLALEPTPLALPYLRIHGSSDDIMSADRAGVAPAQNFSSSSSGSRQSVYTTTTTTTTSSGAPGATINTVPAPPATTTTSNDLASLYADAGRILSEDVVRRVVTSGDQTIETLSVTTTKIVGLPSVAAASDKPVNYADLGPYPPTSPADGGVRGLLYKPWPPLPPGKTVVWMQNERFQEISRWRKWVDRMGITVDTRVPVAWRGSKPSVIFIWTGDEWTRVQTESGESADSALYRVRESLNEFLQRTGYRWFESDTPALASSAAHMRYAWGGELDPSKSEGKRKEDAVKAQAAQDQARREAAQNAQLSGTTTTTTTVTTTGGNNK